MYLKVSVPAALAIVTTKEPFDTVVTAGVKRAAAAVNGSTVITLVALTFASDTVEVVPAVAVKTFVIFLL